MAAALGNYRCTITFVIAGTDSKTPPGLAVGLNLTDVNGSFTNTRFEAVDEAKREILAVALTAISTHSAVLAIVDPPAAGTNPNCYELGIVP